MSLLSLIVLLTSFSVFADSSCVEKNSFDLLSSNITDIISIKDKIDCANISSNSIRKTLDFLKTKNSKEILKDHSDKSKSHIRIYENNDIRVGVLKDSIEKKLFIFNDFDCDLIMYGDFRVISINKEQIDELTKHVRKRSRLYHEFLKPIEFLKIYKKSITDYREGGIDFIIALNSIDEEKTHAIIDNVAYNHQDFGNFLWGYSMAKLGASYLDTKVGSELNGFYFGKLQNKDRLLDDYSDDERSSLNNLSPLMDWHLLEKDGDSDADQRAIAHGYHYYKKYNP